MNRSGYSIAALLLIATTQAMAVPHVYFSSHDDVQLQVLTAIDGSRRFLDAALFELSSPVLAQALRRAAQRGVSVRLLTSEGHTPPLVAEGWNPLLQIRTLGGRQGRHGAMHNKFAVFDRDHLVTGSFNWTSGAEYVNYENALFEDDLGIVNAYSDQFEVLWNKAWTKSTPVRHPHKKNPKKKRGKQKYRFNHL